MKTILKWLIMFDYYFHSLQALQFKFLLLYNDHIYVHRHIHLDGKENQIKDYLMF